MLIIAVALVLIAVACAAVLNEAGRTLLPGVDRAPVPIAEADRP